MASKCRLPVLHQPRSLFQADPEPHQILFSGDPQVLPTKHVSRWISHLLRLPHLLLLTFTSRPLPLPLVIHREWTSQKSPSSLLSFIFSITKSCWFCLLHLSQLCPICIPTVTTRVQDTRGFFFVVVYFLFLSCIPNYKFPMFQSSHSFPIASEECPNS